MTDRRDEITEAARQLIIETSPGSPSIRDVARTCDLSPGAIYTHFRHFDDVLASVYYGMARELLAAMTVAIENCDADDLDARRRSVPETIVAFFERYPELVAWALAQPPQHLAPLAQHFAIWVRKYFDVPRDEALMLAEATIRMLSTLPVMLQQSVGLSNDDVVDWLYRAEIELARTFQQRTAAVPA